MQDGERMLCEAAAIVEHLCHAHAGGRMTVEPGAANHYDYDYDYLYWIGLNDNVLRLFFTPAGPGRQTEWVLAAMFQRREAGYARMIEMALVASPYLAGAQLTCADIMATYCLRSPRMQRARGDMLNAAADLARIAARPAYQRAMAIAEADAELPAAS